MSQAALGFSEGVRRRTASGWRLSAPFMSFPSFMPQGHPFADRTVVCFGLIRKVRRGRAEVLSDAVWVIAGGRAVGAGGCRRGLLFLLLLLFLLFLRGCAVCGCVACRALQCAVTRLCGPQSPAGAAAVSGGLRVVCPQSGVALAYPFFPERPPAGACRTVRSAIFHLRVRFQVFFAVRGEKRAV